MIKTAMEIDRRLQTVGGKAGTYLTFTFFEKDRGVELEVIGWTELRPQPDKPVYIKGVINPWGCEIPVIDLRVLCDKGTTEMTDRTCIVIFEHFEAYRYYFGMVVEELSNVINIASGTENKMSQLLLSAKRHLSTRPELKN